MKLTSRSFVTTIAILLALLVAMPMLVACGGETEPAPAPAPTPAPAPEPAPAPAPAPEPAPEPEPEPAPAPAPEVAEFDVVKDAVAAYLGSPAPNVKAADINMRIADGDAPYIVSVRSADDYAAGHIAGAVNVKFGDLSTIPADEEVLVYCYTGQSASFAAATLGMLGYDVSNLKFGMASWSDDPDVYKKRFNAENDQADYEVEQTANAGGSYAMPEIENTTSDDPAEIVKAAALTVAPKYITVKDLQLKIAEEEEMTILSIRKEDAYAAGHIPGAINAPYGLAVIEALDKINPDVPVYVYCYTGHTSAQATALLQMLGYDAYSMKFGMCAWTGDTEVNKDVCFKPEMAAGYATE